MTGAALAPPPRALLLIGSVGVGRTTALDAIGEELAARGIPGAALDPAGLARYLDRFDELTGILDEAEVEDVTVPIGQAPQVTARAVLAARRRTNSDERPAPGRRARRPQHGVAAHGRGCTMEA